MKEESWKKEGNYFQFGTEAISVPCQCQDPKIEYQLHSNLAQGLHFHFLCTLKMENVRK